MEKQNQTEKMKRLILHTPSANAKGNLHSSGKVEVLQGSTMKSYAPKEMAKMKAVFEQLVSKKIIVVEDSKARFVKSYMFKSLNEAASFLLHRGGDNSASWHASEEKRTTENQPKKKKAPADTKPVSKKQEKKPAHAGHPAKEHPVKAHLLHPEKKQTSYPKKSAAQGKGTGSKRKDPRNPRGIRPQGNDALKAAQRIETTGYVRFAGMGQGVKVKH